MKNKALNSLGPDKMIQYMLSKYLLTLFGMEVTKSLKYFVKKRMYMNIKMLLHN